MRTQVQGTSDHETRRAEGLSYRRSTWPIQACCFHTTLRAVANGCPFLHIQGATVGSTNSPSANNSAQQLQAAGTSPLPSRTLEVAPRLPRNQAVPAPLSVVPRFRDRLDSVRVDWGLYGNPDSKYSR